MDAAGTLGARCLLIVAKADFELREISKEEYERLRSILSEVAKSRVAIDRL